MDVIILYVFVYDYLIVLLLMLSLLLGNKTVLYTTTTTTTITTQRGWCVEAFASILEHFAVSEIASRRWWCIESLFPATSVGLDHRLIRLGDEPENPRGYLWVALLV